MGPGRRENPEHRENPGRREEAKPSRESGPPGGTRAAERNPGSRECAKTLQGAGHQGSRAAEKKAESNSKFQLNMKCLSILAAILCFAAPLTAKSRLETLTLHSQLLNADKSCTVYLPDGYDCDTTRRYPILYLLHGASDTHTAWTE